MYVVCRAQGSFEPLNLSPLLAEWRKGPFGDCFVVSSLFYPSDLDFRLKHRALVSLPSAVASMLLLPDDPLWQWQCKPVGVPASYHPEYTGVRSPGEGGWVGGFVCVGEGC